MELFGDLERAFASAIYPNRLLFAAVGLIALTILAVFAWHSRWDLAARRRPRRTVAAAIIAVVLLGPPGWYLGSPLFLSSTIDEPPPIASRPTPAPSVAPPPVAPSIPSATPPTAGGGRSPAPSGRFPSVERLGTFLGADDFHFGRGTARLIETAPGTYTIRLEDFAVRNGPDLYVYLSPSPDGYATDAVELGRLKADRGNQNYTVPAGTDVSEARSVVIWCKQFVVLFATATLSQCPWREPIFIDVAASLHENLRTARRRRDSP